MVVAHGSRAPGWAERVREFVGHVAESPGVLPVFSAVEATFLEAVPPPVPQTVSRHLAGGATSVVVAPLFLTASTHRAEDLPALLGKPSPPHVVQRLRGEGQVPLQPGRAVDILDLGPIDELLARNVERRLELRSKQRAEEGIVLCAYGSTVYNERWDALMTRVRTHLLKSGFGYVTHAYVGHVVGMSVEPTRAAVTRVARMAGIRRVHVAPLLLGPSRLQADVIGAACTMVNEADPSIKILYEHDAILPDGDLAAHIARKALQHIGVFPTVDRGALA